MQIRTHSLFAEKFKPVRDAIVTPDSVDDCDDVQVLTCKELDQEVKEKCGEGFAIIGWVEFVAKNDLGIGEEARQQAIRVGASLVLFKLWPAKLRSVKYLQDGAIDLLSVSSDPPAILTPKGYSVLKAAFLRPNPSFKRTPAGAA